jgi:hypothetical protein
MKEFYVINLRGEKEPFSLKKVFRSARRAGASEKLAKDIALIIEKQVYPGIKTTEIFQKVKILLRKGDPKAELRFNLKEAMRKLGPSGFPFEKYIGDIFSTLGFKVFLNQKIHGLYAKHEIDFLAEKNKLLYIGECKFRIHPGERIDLRVVLAVYARFLDLKEGNYFQKFEECNIKPILVTNAKFSSQAIKYSQGVGIDLLGWNYPKNKGLEKIIENKKLYPITILPSLTGYLMEVFASRKMMLVQDILKLDIKKFSEKTKIKKDKIISLLNEAKILMENH